MNTLQITENAKNQIAKLLLNEPKGSFFRVSVTGGGCSGFKYSFSIDNNSSINDISIGEVLIDKTSHEFIKNSKLDYEENLMGRSFRIHNPDAKASCGCGISFSI
tara:strand:- start:1994 stop:2308 length:315 start_codon:yes stop_codon:yes gene_type:complete